MYTSRDLAELKARARRAPNIAHASMWCTGAATEDGRRGEGPGRRRVLAHASICQASKPSSRRLPQAAQTRSPQPVRLL